MLLLWLIFMALHGLVYLCVVAFRVGRLYTLLLLLITRTKFSDDLRYR